MRTNAIPPLLAPHLTGSTSLAVVSFVNLIVGIARVMLLLLGLGVIRAIKVKAYDMRRISIE